MRTDLTGRFAALALICPSGAAGADTGTEGVVTVFTDSGSIEFSVEIADDEAERSRGLMFRDSLDEDAGMLFVYPAPRIASFWMKNTKIPLDMIFIDAEGEIVRIAPETVPYSLKSISSPVPVDRVLEIDGGEATRLGIDVGDRVELSGVTSAD